MGNFAADLASLPKANPSPQLEKSRSGVRVTDQACVPYRLALTPLACVPRFTADAMGS